MQELLEVLVKKVKYISQGTVAISLRIDGIFEWRY